MKRVCNSLVKFPIKFRPISRTSPLRSFTMAAAALAHSLSQSKELRAGLEDLLTRRFFYLPSFEIYGGVGGLYDFGPMGCAIKQNLLSHWRNHFVLYEGLLEVECAAMTPEIVLKASGHVDKFTDFMVRDVVTAECYRADKLVEDHIEKLLSDPKKPVTDERRSELLSIKAQAGAMNATQLDEQIKTLGIKATDTGNDLSDAFAFNLMFQTSIGPTGKFTGYLRPETAQGIFVNYRRLLEFNSGRMPFGCAQIGLAFRNEIAPRAGLLRVREFTLAEIEHFVHPQQKDHPRFKDISNVVLSLYGQEHQLNNSAPMKMSVGDAVAQGVINNQTLGYYMARTHLFLIAAGIDGSRLRFRQHLKTEMAHYAADCWDAEIEGTYGWIECVGHADRSAYDLKVHTAKSKVELVAQEVYDQPRMVQQLSIRPNLALMGKTLGKQPGYKLLLETLKTMEEDDIACLQSEISKGKHSIKLADGNSFELDSTMLDFKSETKKVSSAKYTPSVIEPSFGIGRILYHILEHAYKVREEAAPVANEKEAKAVRAYLTLPAFMAPTKVAVLPISTKESLNGVVESLTRAMTVAGLSARADTSSQSIGRRYARLDEVGVPFILTVDFESLEDKCVTLRERDSMQQIRIPIAEAPSVVGKLVQASIHAAQNKILQASSSEANTVADEWEWVNVYQRFPQVQRPEGGDE